MTVPKGTAQQPDVVNVYVGVPAKGDDKSCDGIGSTAITALGTVLAAAAWPLGIVAIAVLFRIQIGKLIDRIRRMKGPGGFEIFTAEELLEELPEPPQPAGVQPDPVVEQAVQLGPIDAVVSAWVGVERGVHNLYERVQLVTTGDKPPQFRRKLDFLVSAGTIDRPQAREIQVLNEIRNRVVHNPDERMSDEGIRGYVKNCKAVVQSLNDIAADQNL